MHGARGESAGLSSAAVVLCRACAGHLGPGGRVALAGVARRSPSSRRLATMFERWLIWCRFRIASMRSCFAFVCFARHAGAVAAFLPFPSHFSGTAPAERRERRAHCSAPAPSHNPAHSCCSTSGRRVYFPLESWNKLHASLQTQDATRAGATLPSGYSARAHIDEMPCGLLCVFCGETWVGAMGVRPRTPKGRGLAASSTAGI